jgi:aryl-alcohol dehydrogenase
MSSILVCRPIRGITQGDAIPDLFILPLIEQYKENRFSLDRMVECYALDRIEEAVEDMQQGPTRRPV